MNKTKAFVAVRNMKNIYAPVRAFHLYSGLFVSTLVIVFAASVLVFNHPDFFKNTRQARAPQAYTLKIDSIPARAADLLTAKAILSELDIAGEIDFINKTDSGISFPVNTTRKSYLLRVNKLTGVISVSVSSKNIFQATTYLHSMPGPHNINIRGNSGFIKLWRYLTDIIVYSVLFLTVSGIFMWSFYRSERKWGLITAATGIIILLILMILTF